MMPSDPIERDLRTWFLDHGAEYPRPDLGSSVMDRVHRAPQRGRLSLSLWGTRVPARESVRPTVARTLAVFASLLLVTIVAAGALVLSRPPVLGAWFLDGTDWSLDLAASKLDGRVEPGYDFDITSGLSFAGHRFSGGTGYGGGCDVFRGSYEVQGEHLRLVLDKLGQGCGHGSPQTIVDRIVGAWGYEFRDCPGFTLGQRPDDWTTCATFVLRGDSWADILVYHRRVVGQ